MQANDKDFQKFRDATTTFDAGLEPSVRMRLSHPLEHRHTVTYGDLSTSLKVFVVLGWIVFGMYSLAILIGFITGFMGT